MLSTSLMLIIFLVGNVTSYGCGPCTCFRDEDFKIHANCSYRGLTFVPDDLPLATRFLDLSNNSISPKNLSGVCDYTLFNLDISGNQLTSLSLRQFSKCFISESINFADNVLEEVSRESLSGLQYVKNVSNLESLYFHPGSVSTLLSVVELSIVIHQVNITENMFENLTRLQDVILDIRNAMNIPENIFEPISSTVKRVKLITKSIKVIGVNILKDCSVLEVFILLGRQLNSVPDTLFQTTPELKTICMRSVGSLPRGIFDDLDRLETLELHEVEDMPSDLFDGLVRLMTLDLSECSFSTIPDGWFKDLLSLGYLNLESTGLRFLTEDDFVGLEKLVTVDLSNNRLKSLDAFSFKHIGSTVQYIDLSGNELKVIDDDIFTDLSRLDGLDLSSNKIHSISGKAFNSLPKLKHLTLHDNKIYALHAGVFSNNEKLEVLDLSANVVSETEASVFNHLESLLVLNVSDNRLKNITHVIVSLTPSVRFLDLSLNHLPCACISPELLTVLKNVILLGTCEKPDENSLEEIRLQDFMYSEICLPKPTTTTSTYSITTSGIAETSETSILQKETDPTIKSVVQYSTSAHSMPTTKHTLSQTQATRAKTKLGLITLSPDDNADVSNVNNMFGAPEDGNTNAETVFGFEEEKPTSKSYYIAVACISVVSVFSIAIMVYLWYRKMRRQRGYEVSNIADQDLSNIVAGTNGQQTGSTNGPITLTDVPSIQIDKVDGNFETDSTGAK